MNGMSDQSSVTPAFINKLWALVEDSSTDHLICWDHSGRSFHIYDQLEFAREILPMYFKHGNIASFIRQLNMYGFRKVSQIDNGALKTERDDMEFHHPYFVRDNENLLSAIKRKPPTATIKESDKVASRGDNVTGLLSEMKMIKDKQETMTSKLESMKRENEALWREVASLRQKHSQQQQIVNKLIQFLVTIVRQKPPNVATVSRRRPLMINSTEHSDEPPPAKLARQYSLEGTRYTVDMPDTPGSPLNTTGVSRQGGVTIREVNDSVGSPQDVGSPLDFGEIDIVNIPEETVDTTTNNMGEVVDSNKTLLRQQLQQNPSITVKSIGRKNTNNPGQATNNMGEVVDSKKTLLRQQLQQNPSITVKSIGRKNTNNPGQATNYYVPVPSSSSSTPITVMKEPIIVSSPSFNPNSNASAKPLSLSLPSGVGGRKATLNNLNTNAPTITDTSTGQDFILVNDPSNSLAVIPDVSPSSSLNIDDNSRNSSGRSDMDEMLGSIDSELESLKDMLASGQYSLDANTLMGLFHPEGPLPATPDHLLAQDPFSGMTAGKGEQHWNNIVGNELIQYAAPDDLSSILGLDADQLNTDRSTELDNLDTDIFPELDQLNTPQIVLSPYPPSYQMVTSEFPTMEEVD